MKRTGESGSINILLIPVILLSLLFIGAAVFGYWAFSGRQDYKNNVDQKIASANQAAVAAEDTKKDAQFAQDEKQPLKVYTGPSAYGGLKLSFPKTWSGYVNEDQTGDTDVDGYFYPDVVPNIMNPNNSFALRVQIANQSYSSVLQQFSNMVSAKKVTVTPYSFPQVSSVIGSRLDGEVVQNKQGSMVIMPLRDKTLTVWTESSDFLADFNNNILPNLTFQP